MPESGGTSDVRIKCIACNASVVPTLGGSFRCVDCGKPVVKPHLGAP